MKTIFYVDGYNLYYGCLKHSTHKWLDLKILLAEQILHQQDPESQLLHINYFTAPILAKVASRGGQAANAQSAYSRALQNHLKDHIRIIQGYYALEKGNLPVYQHPLDKQNRTNVWRLEEKQTDVNIALEAYRDAVKGRADQLVFVTNDTDIAPALKMIREDLGSSIQIGIILPVSEGSSRPGNKQLSENADWTRTHIRNEELAASQLPDTVPTKKKPIRKPDYW